MVKAMYKKEINVFISYRRRNGGIAYASILNEQLTALGINCFFDVVSMHDFNKNFESNILSNIEKSDYVILLLQDGWLEEKNNEDYFLKEIRYALEKQKELILLPVGADFVWENQKNIPPDIIQLNKLNLCTAFEITNMQESLDTLLSMIKSDNADRHLLMMSQIRSAAPAADSPILQKSRDISNIDIEERWKNAERVSLMAIGCSGIVTRYDQVIKRFADSGTKFRFLGIDPEGASAEDFTKNKINGNTTGARDNFLRENYNTTLQAFRRIRSPLNSVSYRLTSDHITFTMHWVECKNDAESYIFIEFLPVRTAGIKQDVHSATVIKRNDSLYSFFANQFEEVWSRGRIGTESNMVEGCEFCFPPEKDDKFILATTKYWRIYFANNQNYPGRCIIPLLRHCESLSDVTPPEMEELHHIIAVIEKIWREELGAVNFNWGCLMNTAYRQHPYIPHVHFHCIPRYDKPFHTSEGDFTDDLFGSHYTISEEYQLPEQDRLEWSTKLKGLVQQELKLN